MSGKEESPALDFLDTLIEETPQVQRAAQRERLRLELARFMKKARDAAGMSQHEVAAALDVSQAWISKLESPNYDHKLESVLSYFDAIGGQMNLSVEVNDSAFQIWGTAPTWESFVGQMEEALSGFSLWREIEDVWNWVSEESTQGSDTRSGQVVFLEDYRPEAPRKEFLGEACVT